MSSHWSEDGCVFRWTVIRINADGSTSEFTDEATVPCPDTEQVTFYCTAAKQCPGAQLTLRCVHDDTPSGA